MKRAIQVVIGIFTTTTGLVTVGVLAIIANTTVDSLKMRSYQPELASKITDRNGKILRYVYEDQYRIWVDDHQISENMKEATIAMEDHRFYLHPGFDMIAIFRALKVNATEDELEGGSTLTQQYIKNAFLSPERTIPRKLREVYLAFLLEKNISKEEILVRYLNQVSYGSVYYGVETAAQHYFHTSADELTVSQAATLASLTKAPTYYTNPDNYEELVARQQTVLQKMLQQEFINQEEYQQAKSEKIVLQNNPSPKRAPHFTQYVIDSLKQTYEAEELATGGYTIATTLDYDLHQKVQKTVTETVADSARYNISNGAAVVLKPASGEVLAWVGSKDFYDTSIGGQYDVLRGYRQPGSTLKPFLYSLALESGFTAATQIIDERTVYTDTQEEPYKPVNYDGKYHGTVSIRKALGNSLNIPATKMIAVLEVPTYIEYLQQLSIDNLDPKRAGLSLALGGYEIQPIDLATAYAALANQGTVVEPQVVLSMKNHRGEAEPLPELEKKQVIKPEVAYIISDILADNSARTISFGSNSLLNFPDKKVAVKTGTSNDKRDNWAIGYTPEYVTLAWVGNNDNSPMAQVASGVSGATPIWREVQETLADRTELSWYDQPATVVSSTYQANSGGKYCGNGGKATELFVEGTQPDECLPVASTVVNEGEEMARLLASGGSASLYEVRGGEEVKVLDLSPDEVQQFYNNPFSIIEKYSDQLQADEVPTKVFIKEKEATPRENPLENLIRQRRVATLAN